MRQELTWGAGATALAIIAAVGISLQSGSKTSGPFPGGRPADHTVARSKPRKNGMESPCSDSLEMLQQFFRKKDLAAPDSCFDSGTQATPDKLGLQPRFIIATLPDPLHTHFSLLFDRLIEAIQQGAQDEGYDYDSSWLPWETQEQPLVRLPDQDEADDRKEKREDQPGILLFRSARQPAYQKALVVFVVGEEPTRGIHRQQFDHAIAWITALQKQSDTRVGIAILGPTFSGSFPSLTQLLSAGTVLNDLGAGPGHPLAIFSGSASSQDSGNQFASTQKPAIDFRSFVQDDNTILDRFCRYLGQTTNGTFDLRNLAILSEDQTAYGNHSASKTTDSTPPLHCDGATWIYYPRDISTLRAAYQNQSMFNSLSAQQNQEAQQRRSLPTDLADPAGQEHDTVRTYAGNQTPLSEEAQLLGIVGALRAHRAEYVVLRSSNTLDPLFLANFLRRDYPEARIVVLNSDLLFQRGQDAMALSGVLTLSTYPLSPWGRDWTALPPFESHSHRVFPENSTEGTYIASRLLLQSFLRREGHEARYQCFPLGPEVFLPALRCQATEAVQYVPLPDYAAPYWTEFQPCGAATPPESCKPATWLSVITRSGTWPLATLNEHTLPALNVQAAKQEAVAPGTSPPDSAAHPKWPSMPRSMKVLLVSLFGLSLFHAACCWFASFTAKPALRAHFATAGWRHRVLILIGSFLIALMALLAGWGCGILAAMPGPPTDTGAARTLVFLACGIAGAATVLNVVANRRLNPDSPDQQMRSLRPRVLLTLFLFCLLILAFFLTWVHPLEGALILANRAFAYWRSMNLTSGVSPLVPFLSLTAGLYIWFWYSLHGLALFGPDRPCLPPLSKLTIQLPQPEKNGAGPKELKFSMFSQESAANPAERVATPLSWDTIFVILSLFTFVVLLVACLTDSVPVRSLGAKRYSLIFCLWLNFYFSLILAEGWQIWRTWSGVRQLLVFLDRLALRRTLGALAGFSWGTVWKMSGNVLDVRYKLVSRQLECLNHLHNSLRASIPKDNTAQGSPYDNANESVQSVEDGHNAGTAFAEWYLTNYNRPRAAGLQRFRAFQKQIAETTGVVLTKLLIPAWRTETRSLIQIDPASKGNGTRKPLPPPSSDELVRNAEELVCLTYLGFAQNLLGRVRTTVLGGVSLFVAATIAVASYPFDPRPILSGVMLLLFVAFGAVVVFVYADMHRDATLSYVTNTNPGELGSEFWLKLIGYGAAPLLGLITTIFPEWSGFLFSWLQPGLSSLR